MAEEDKVKYSDIIEPDDSFERLITQLDEISKSYETMVNAIRVGATKIVTAIKSASGATSDGRAKIDEAAVAASRLERAEKELAFSLSATGKQVAWLKAQTADNNRTTVEQQRFAAAAATSYNKLKLELKDNIALYKSLTEAERKDKDMGEQVLATILNLKDKIASLDESMKRHIATISLEQKAREKLAYLNSESGKRYLELKAKIADNSRATVEQQRYTAAAATSYDKLKLELKDNIALYKSLTDAERQDADMGGKVLTTILSLKSQIAALDEQMKLHEQTMTLEEKARKKLAYLTSESGQQYLELKAKIAELTEARRTKVSIAEKEAQVLAKLAAIENGEYDNLKLYTTQLHEANRIKELTIQINNSEEGSYNRLSAQYSLNKIKLNQMGEADAKTAEAKRKLEEETKALYEQMIKLQEATGKHTLSVGNYKKAWNGLGMSVNQIVREIPAAAISINTFFLGISNNVPILIDEIQKLKRVNEELIAQGKPTKNVIKEVVKSLFSWNTALVLLLTVFAMYGEQILDNIAKMLKLRKATLSTVEMYKNVAKELETTNDNYGKNRVSVQQLTEEYKKLKTTAEKNQWIKDNKTEFDKLGVSINNVNDADNAFINNTAAIIEALKLRAKATAAQELASKKYEEALIKRNKAELKAVGTFDEKGNFIISSEAQAKLDEENAKAKEAAKQIASSFTGQGVASGGYATAAAVQQAKALGREAKAAEDAGDAYFKLADGYAAAAKEALKVAGIEEAHKKDREAKGRTPRDAEDTLESLSLAATKAYQKSVTDLEREEIKKRRKEYLEAARIEIADLQVKYNKIQRILDGQDSRYKKLTEEQKGQAIRAQEDIVNAIENRQKELSQNLSLLTYQQQELDAQNQLESLNLQIALVKKGSEEELKLRTQILAVEEQIALARNKQLPPSQQQDESAISAGFKKQRADIVVDYNITAFDQQQALAKAQFDAVKHNEKEITKFKLGQEKERWDYQIALAEAGSLDWSQAQIDAAKATVTGINNELKEVNSFIARIADRGLGESLLESLGFNEDQIGALSEAANTVIDQFGDILDAEVELAEKEKELADERVDNAKSALEAEIEARNNGYANNVDTAKKNLALERKNQAEKQKILEQAQRRQQNLDTVTQASSLITASANLWKAFSSIPIVGPALALAAIATMWTSFAAAKIKAKQVTAASKEQEYGEGGIEFLEGGSHASGNDIDLHTKNKRGRNMRAEGGEALAIINKRSTRKYRRVLPEVINSFNKGNFEDKFMSSLDSANNTILMNNARAERQVDLSLIEDALIAIKKQGATRVISRADGAIVEVKDNVVRIIKND